MRLKALHNGLKPLLLLNFNPTIVRLKVWLQPYRKNPLRYFNPTIVRLKAKGLTACALVSLFQSYHSAIKGRTNFFIGAVEVQFQSYHSAIKGRLKSDNMQVTA